MPGSTESALQRFARDHGGAPRFVVRAPGRVNLIGEHTDYNGLPVFPLALQLGVELVGRPRADGQVRATNTAARFTASSFALAPRIEPAPAGDWSNYLRAAAQHLVERHGLRRGLDLTVTSDLPSAAGLSSSSALVVAAALALLEANAVELPRLELMRACAEAERYVGTHSGGMDQAICLAGRRGHALVIDFEPLRFEAVPIPADWRFVVADTGVRAEKSGAARAAYNRCTAECRAALEAFQAARVVPPGTDGPASYAELAAAHGADELCERAARYLPPVLLARFRHVLTEAARVRAAREAMQRGDLPGFGRLMDASHASLRDDYRVSCAELDELCSVLRTGGAAGARLTGAGFGGCAVALCREREIEPLLARVEERYLRPRGLEPRNSLLVAEASDGARVERLRTN